MARDSSFWAFSEDGREFIIRRRKLPDTWRNHLATDDFNCSIDQTGAGHAYGRSPSDDRVTADECGRTIFVRDAATGSFWTLNGTTGEQPSDWQCRHGMGSTTISHTTEGVASSVTYFLPLRGATEIWRIRLHNTTDQRRELGLFSHVTWRLGFVRTPPMNYNVVSSGGVIWAENYFWNGSAHRSSLPEFNKTWDRIAFMAASVEPDGFDCLPEGFVGDGSALAPQAVREGACRGSFGRGGENIGVLQHNIAIEPGGTFDMMILVGYAPDKAAARKLVRRYGDVAKADEAFAALGKWWDTYLGSAFTETPDREINQFNNGFTMRGIYTRYYLRYGYRDTAQDVSGLVIFDRERARLRMEAMMRAQFKCGNTLHDVPSLRFDSHLTVNSDPPLWLPWVISAYLRETGDWAFLHKRIPFRDSGDATVYEHALRSLDWVLSQSGRFGLPLIKCGDWNDALAGAWEKGVSVWMADFLYLNLNEMAQVAQRFKRPRDAQRLAREAARIARTVNEKCWDGKWYIRGFDSTGKPFGSKSCREGSIFANPQSWGVLSGLAPADRALTAMKSVERIMDTPVGIPMLFPAYTRPNPALGEITRFAPYHHHNGGVWNHLNTWVCMAECKLGRTDRALEVYRRFFPPRLAREVDRFTAMPYAYGSWTNTPRSRLYGKADASSNTGTTVFAWHVLMQGFCGVSAEHDGLRVEPRLPTSWKWARVRRPFRDATYDIRIENPRGLAVGKVAVELDGKPIEGNLLPLPTRREHQVLVRIS
jgi:cellobiose phosphorylase